MGRPKIRTEEEIRQRKADWARKYYHQHPEASREKQRKWREANPELRAKHYRTSVEKNRERLKNKFARLRMEMIEAYGGACVCCGESAHEFLTIDHIFGRTKETRVKHKGRLVYADLKKRGYPKDNFRLLCMNCNFAYGVRGYCPHQKVKE